MANRYSVGMRFKGSGKAGRLETVVEELSRWLISDGPKISLWEFLSVKKPKIALPDLSLEQLQGMMSALGVRRLLMKELAPNDNAKNQPYLSGSLEVTNIIPAGEVRVETTEKGNKVMKAPLPLEWLQPDGTSIRAPGAQLILYPQYPEVRISGSPVARIRPE